MPVNYNIDLNKNVDNNLFKNKKDNFDKQYKQIQEYYCKAWSNLDAYHLLYKHSIENPCEFWDSQLNSIYFKYVYYLFYINKKEELNSSIYTIHFYFFC